MSTVVATLCSAAMLLFAWNGRLRARHVRQWQLGVLASEFGVFFTPFALAPAVWCAGSGRAGIPGVLSALAATGLFLCPEAQSAALCRKLPGKLQHAFAKVGRADPCPPSPRDERLPEIIGANEPVMNPQGPAKSPENPHLVRDGGQGSARPTFSYPASGGIPRQILFYPATSPADRPAPCVVVVHSGGWESGSPEEFADCHRALSESGYAVACVEYGLTPEFSWPAQRDDVRAAIRWIKDNAQKLGVNPEKLVLLGRSAGGQVALCAAYDEPDPAIRGVAAFYAPTDMVFSWRGAYDGDILNSPKLLKNYLGGRPHETPEAHAAASPTVHAARGGVPTLLLHGGRDEIVWCLQARRLARVLRRAGTPHLALIVPWGRHAFDYRHAGPGGRVAFRALKVFLDTVTA